MSSSSSSSLSSHKKLNVGILGATGTVGQRFIRHLEGHPWFIVSVLGASDRSAGKTYKTACNWKLAYPMPDKIKSTVVVKCNDIDKFKDCHLIFSALDADIAEILEPLYSKAGIFVFSNAKSYRMNPVVPLIVPYVNSSHLDIISLKKSSTSESTDKIVTNSNCATVNVVVPCKALMTKYGAIKEISVVTMQAISGGGYPGVPSLDILDNVVPFISGEEEKVEIETLKILGTCTKDKIENLENCKVSASCNRVPVLDGHMACVSITFCDDSFKFNEDEIAECLSSFGGDQPEVIQKCPSAPKQLIHVFREMSRPQPRLDRDLNNGYSVSVGRIRPDNLFHLKFVSCTHNTVIGAAGSSIINAELAYNLNFF